MSKIRILPEILSNKIAAGEVVERPASVVRELVENALDAGSRRIVVEVEKGGKSLVRVADNGTGMGRDDALLALERYATSKLRDDSDLFAIQTLGFRGEALPSIAAVSRFSLVTRESGADTGVDIDVEGGRIRRVTEVGAPVGTMVTVRSLFFNTPARRKFMKTVATEMGHISEVLAGRALSHPEVYFKLSHNGRAVNTWIATGDAMDRVADVIGSAVRPLLLPVKAGEDGMSVAGWVAAPPAVRATGQGIYTFVNRRCIRSPVVQHALVDGYAGRLMKGQFPVAVMFITLPFEEVDVNVHPTKLQVRFVRQKAVHDMVRRAVAAALDRLRTPISMGHPSEAAPQRVGERLTGFGSGTKRSAENSSNDRPAGGVATTASDRSGWQRSPETAVRAPESVDRFPPSSPGSAPPRQSGLWPGGRFSDLALIGQAHNTYILCQSDDGLVIIDQHAAHERVLYEALSRRSADALPAMQRLLLPEPIDLGFRQTPVLESLIPELARFGITVEPFGPNAFAVTAVPALLADRPAAELIREIVEKTLEIGVEAGTERILDEALKLMACHGAIRGRQALGTAQMQALLTQLDACRNPFHCPHGRPTWIRWQRRDLEKLFGRLV